MANDATIEQEVLETIQDQSVQARARPSPWDSSSAPGIGPGFEGAWWGGGTLFLGLQQAADEIILWSYYPQRRDRQLRNFWKTEAILSGGIYSFSARISALPAKIKGPVKAKQKATEMLHALDLQKLVIDMLTTDNGFFIERVGPGRPDKPLNPKLVSYLSVMDSQQIWRTFDPEYPVIYINPYTGAYHKMHYSRIITGASCPQPDELARGIGYCAVSRALRYSQIQRDISIFKHEKIGGRFTRALGVVSGMTPSQFNKSIDASKEIDDANGFTRYRGIPWLVATTGKVEASIIDLASLPDGFNSQTDTETYVNVLALAFGTDVREFWPGQGSGATKADATVQHEKARGKGIADVTSTVERVLNWGVLDAIGCEVEFDYTDDAEQMATAQYHFQVITNVSTMQQAGNISTEQGTALLINAGVIDPEVIKNVAAAESAEPADTESPYENTLVPMQEVPKAPVIQGGPQLAKPPAAPNATSPTPEGGIKPPPPSAPRLSTGDMKPVKGRGNKAHGSIVHLHAHTNAYQDKLKGLMQDFFSGGYPSTDAELENRLIKLKSAYTGLSEENINQAFDVGRNHASQAKTKEVGVKTAIGSRRLGRVRRKSSSFFDGFINDLRTGVKAAGALGFADLAARFTNRIGQYAGHVWNAIWEGFADFFRQRGGDYTIAWRLGNPPTGHCEDCPNLADLYHSVDEILAQGFGLPGSGETQCGGACYCYLEAV